MGSSAACCDTASDTLTRLQLAELLLDNHPERRAEAQAHLDFSIAEFRAMKMTPSLERALRRKGVLGP